MGSWIALIASTVIGSLVLLSFQRFSNDVRREAYVETLDHLAYGNLDESKRLLEADFMRIGLGMNDPTVAAFTQATATDVTFKMDSDGNGVPETMRYYLSTTAAAGATKNPNDKFLMRQINGGTAQIRATGLTSFNIQYFDAAGNATAVLGAIRMLVVSLTMGSNFGADADYPKLLWQGRFTPPGLVQQ
ncbi:MAG: hypothetical protein ACREOI_28040 [bacterium]